MQLIDKFSILVTKKILEGIIKNLFCIIYRKLLLLWKNILRLDIFQKVSIESTNQQFFLTCWYIYVDKKIEEFHVHILHHHGNEN